MNYHTIFDSMKVDFEQEDVENWSENCQNFGSPQKGIGKVQKKSFSDISSPSKSKFEVSFAQISFIQAQ